MNFIKARILTAVLFASLTATVLVGCGPRPEKIPENTTRNKPTTFGKDLPKMQGISSTIAEVPGHPDSIEATPGNQREYPSNTYERSNLH